MILNKENGDRNPAAVILLIFAVLMALLLAVFSETLLKFIDYPAKKDSDTYEAAASIKVAHGWADSMVNDDDWFNS